MEAGGTTVESGTRREAEERAERRISAPAPALEGAERKPLEPREPIFEVRDVAVTYDGTPAVRDITLDVGRNRITALIGPSGSGKSTLIRCFNRMNDLIPGARVDGSIIYHGQDLNGERVDPVEVRKLIGWCSRSRTRFPSRSTTTSPLDRA
jgi:phosphate transport system ATP-binding protein